MNMAKLEEWLSTVSKATRKSYLNGAKKFEKYYGKEIEELLNLSDEQIGHEVERFYFWLKEQGHGQNSCRNLINSPLQFCKHFGKNPRYKRSIGMYRTVMSDRQHKMTIQQVQKMAEFSDLRQQVMLEVYLMGFRIRDVTELKWKTFDRLDEDAPIEIAVNTSKENVSARAFISPEFQQLLKRYLTTINKENEYLLQSREGGKLSPKQLEHVFQSLAKKAGIVPHGSLAWHSGRRLFLRTGVELGISVWALKLMCGKSIQASDSTYFQDAELRESFQKLSNVLRIFPKHQLANGKTKEVLDVVFQTLRALVEQQLQQKGLMKTRPVNWQQIYEKLLPQEEQEAHKTETVVFT